MVYVIVDNRTNEAKIYKDATQICDILGVSVRTIWRHSEKTHIERGNYTLYYVPNGINRSNRGQKW